MMRPISVTPPPHQVQHHHQCSQFLFTVNCMDGLKKKKSLLIMKTFQVCWMFWMISKSLCNDGGYIMIPPLLLCLIGSDIESNVHCFFRVHQKFPIIVAAGIDTKPGTHAFRNLNKCFTPHSFCSITRSSIAFSMVHASCKLGFYFSQGWGNNRNHRYVPAWPEQHATQDPGVEYYSPKH